MLAVVQLRAGVRAHHQRLGLADVLVRGEPVVHMDAALVRDHVRAVAAGDQRGVQPLAVLQTVHGDGLRLIGVEPRERLAGLMNGVLPHPRACRVRGHAVRDHVEPHRAVAAALDAAVRRLADDREVALDPFGMSLNHLAQAVLLGHDLLMVVEHEGQIDLRLGQRSRQIQQRRIGGLHIGGAAPPYHALIRMRGGDLPTDRRVAGLQPARREVVDHRHRVQMPAQDHPTLAAQIRACHQRIAVPTDRQMRLAAQEPLHHVGQRPLVVAHRIHGHDLFHQRGQRLFHRGVRREPDLRRHLDRRGLHHLITHVPQPTRSHPDNRRSRIITDSATS